MSVKVLVIGGGAAGMMAAVSAADHGAEVTLVEKNEKLGKKLYITGKGRCNITNNCDVQDFFGNVISNPRFLYSAVYGFTPGDICEFLENEGLKLKEERGKRVFPDSDKSSDVIRTFSRALARRNVRLLFGSTVSSLEISQGVFKKAVLSDGRSICADELVIATGGLSYSSTGSTGDGYVFAEDTGHRIVKQEPSLVPLTVKEEYVRELEGLSLRNICIEIGDYSDFGEMLFTSDGVSGPVILSASAKLCRRIADSHELPLFIDLKPALDENQLDKRVLRDFEAAKNKDFKNCLQGLLPSKLIPVIIRLSDIAQHKKVNEITKDERKQLVHLLKHFKLTITGTKGFSQAVITQGGIDVRDISPSDMRSKIIKNMFFAGEVIDTDAFTGGFNLQIAWSTGYLAGKSAAAGGNR